VRSYLATFFARFCSAVQDALNRLRKLSCPLQCAAPNGLSIRNPRPERNLAPRLTDKKRDGSSASARAAAEYTGAACSEQTQGQSTFAKAPDTRSAARLVCPEMAAWRKAAVRVRALAMKDV
jgi:hypothetical protein